MDIPSHNEIYSFVIQAGAPRFQQSPPADGDSLCEAIESCFSSVTERVFIGWNYIYFPLDYKYDISVIAADVVDMIQAISSSPGGEWKVTWPSSGFFADWHVSWTGSEVRIVADWRVVNGDAVDLLVKSPVLALGKWEFLYEWRAPLAIVLQALAHSGYTRSNCPPIGTLSDAVAMLTQPGFLYRIEPRSVSGDDREGNG